ncbi:dihydroxy-acid dehydratase, partial [Stenotrophomonas sp. SrG]|uniref:dihydroxy-acid dehydratase domain-containing protein n=1 Tax=Stenotrophomonas sp. SrG TaxID=3414430 RepID=UPI003CEC08BD
SCGQPDTPLRAAPTRPAAGRARAICALGEEVRPLGRLLAERALVNAVFPRIATGGSPTHPNHWTAGARAAGIVLPRDDMD